MARATSRTKRSTKKKSAKKKSTKKKSTKKKSTKKKSTQKRSTKKKSTQKKSTKKKSTKKSPATSVVAWIRALPPPKRALVDAARKLVRAAVPGVDEAIKWGQPVFSGKGPFCYIMARGRDHVTLGFWDGVHLPDPKARLQGEGGRMRHVKIFERGDLDNAVRQLVQRAAARDAKRKS